MILNQRNKRDLSNVHKPFFEYDELNNITKYKCRVCIDRVHIKAYLTTEEIEELLAMFKYRTVNVAEGVIRYIINLVDTFGVYITLEPYNRLNASMQLHPMFTTNKSGDNSSAILKIINSSEWFIRRLDIAFDFTTPFTSSATLKRHGNQLQKNYPTGRNIGSTKNSHAKINVCHYDRSKKTKTLQTDFINRFEARIQFEMKERVTFATLDHMEVARRLQKELFIPHLYFSSLNRNEKRLVKMAGKENKEDYFKKSLTKKQYETLRKKFKQSRVCLEDSYLDARNYIYDFLL